MPYETRHTIHNDIMDYETGACSIYFRIPFTVYFVGRDWFDVDGKEKSPLLLYRKVYDGQGYYFAKL